MPGLLNRKRFPEVFVGDTSGSTELMYHRGAATEISRAEVGERSCLSDLIRSEQILAIGS